MGRWYKNTIAGASKTIGIDAELVNFLESRNEEEVARLNETLEEARQREGDTEISEALKTRANYLTRIGDKRCLGSRIDIVLTIVRIGFFADNTLITAYMQKAEKLIDEGGDWDRRNRLKFKPAADLFLDALSTLIISVNDLVAMAVISGTPTLSRPELEKREISAPEVNQVVPELPVLAELYKNLYESHYDKFSVRLPTLEQTILLPSRILNPLARHFREMRILAYTQLLESYRSLTLTSLSAAFGVGEAFLDSELSRFIASGRIHARIDKVNGVVETWRPSKKSAQYDAVVRRGDLLLNEVQRLSKVLHYG
ncbi:hypothetical protein FA15DRAFT_683411 [Coprinopsis marcescibilis]|uniref:PCI domain-containing protein n=1 Tax=Coprinopsis marcescibilis TaxID=230819 RepID=A0A5C3KDC8_COPMA|nr:hypothetical protein FA15DRAFT_683411 [Coprinopsis marcescibilis]